jgi:hypothetical protein
LKDKVAKAELPAPSRDLSQDFRAALFGGGHFT